MGNHRLPQVGSDPQASPVRETNQKVVRHAFDEREIPNSTPSFRCQWLPEGPMPGGVKGKERAGRNRRNHHQHKLLKAQRRSHSPIHRRPGNQINHLVPPLGISDPLLWTSGRSPEEPGTKRRGSSRSPAPASLPWAHTE